MGHQAWTACDPDDMTSTPLVVGVPVEVKAEENRVALTPDGVREAAAYGITVLVEAGAGRGSRIPDDEYLAAGAQVVRQAEVWERADLICKVKEPQPEELAFMRPGLVLFAYLHLAGYPAVADELLNRGVTAFAYETVQTPSGDLPLLAPMSEVAGRMALQIGTRYLERNEGGRGVLLGGVPGVQPARVVVLGAGNVGWNAARLAAGLGADVRMLDKSLERLRTIDQIHGGRIITLSSNRGAVARVVAEADLVIGAVLVAGGRAPTVVTEDMVQTMKPGSVIIDVAIDQGGCVETSRETTHADPIYHLHEVVHYAVGNIPAAVPYTSTHALTNATLPYVVELARRGAAGAVQADESLALGCNIHDGMVTNAAVGEALGRDYVPVSEAFSR